VRDKEVLPLPSEVHSWYADKPWVLNWVAGKIPQFDKYMLRIPVIPSVRAYLVENIDTYPSMVREIQMTRQQAWGLAPYVGDPFIYTWWVGTDTYGRQVSSGAEIQYIKA
jgi:hypothetical protein